MSLTPSLGAFVYSPSGSTQPGAITGLKFSYDIIGSNIADSIGIEGTVNYFATFGDKTVNGMMLRADAVYLITPRANLVPLIAVGAGDMLVSSGSTNTSNLLINYGAGFKYFFEDWLAWRVDARHILVYRDVNTRNAFELTGGLTYVFGKEHKKRKAAKPPKITAPAVPVLPTLEEPVPAQTPLTHESYDKSLLEKLEVIGPAVIGVTPRAPEFPQEPLPEPPVPRPRAYKPVGPPAPAAPLEKPAPPPEAPPSPEENPEVFPETEPQAKARFDSRPQQAKVRTRRELQAELKRGQVPQTTKVITEAGQKVLSRVTIGFDLGSDQVKSRYDKRLAALSATIKATPGATVRIEGHTDANGKSSDLSLSIKRARRIKEELVRLGIDPRRIAAVKADRDAKGARTAKKERTPSAVAVVTVVTARPGSKSLAELFEESQDSNPFQE